MTERYFDHWDTPFSVTSLKMWENTLRDIFAPKKTGASQSKRLGVFSHVFRLVTENGVSYML